MGLFVWILWHLSLLMSVRCFPHNELSTIVPSAIRLELTSGVHIKANVSEISSSGEWLEVSLCCVEDPRQSDWLALYTPAGVDPTVTSPVQYWDLRDTEGYMDTGSALIRAQVFNHRTETVQFVLMRGPKWSSGLAAKSSAIPVINRNLPGQGHLALTGRDREMLVQWTAMNVGAPMVKWGKESGKYPYSSEAESVTYSRDELRGLTATKSGWLFPGYFHRALMTDLEPGQEYFYRFGDSKYGMSEEFSFIAPPLKGDKGTVKIMVFADMGTITDHWAVGSRLTIPRLKEMVGGCQMIFHNGDVGYAMGYESTWDLFMEGLQPLATRVPYMTSVGNHERDWPGTGDRFMDGSFDSGGECGIPYRRRFRMPVTSPEEDYFYSFDLGLIHFLVLDTEDDMSFGSKQFQFISDDLDAVDRTITPWLVVCGHRPMYINSWDSRPVQGDIAGSLYMRSYLEDLFHEHKVDLVVQGHNHSYQRTCPVYKEECKKMGEAPVYVDVGNAGAGLNTNPVHGSTYMKVVLKEFGFSTISANETHMTLTSIRSEDGAILDTVEFERYMRSLVDTVMT